MTNIEHYPERIRIDAATDTGLLYGPFNADRTNGRSDMDSCTYIRADIHRGAVEEIGALKALLRRAYRALPDHSSDHDNLAREIKAAGAFDTAGGQYERPTAKAGAVDAIAAHRAAIESIGAVSVTDAQSRARALRKHEADLALWRFGGQ